MVVLTPAGARRTVSFSEQQPLGVCMQNAMTHAHTLTLTRTHTPTLTLSPARFSFSVWLPVSETLAVYILSWGGRPLCS